MRKNIIKVDMRNSIAKIYAPSVKRKDKGRMIRIRTIKIEKYSSRTFPYCSRHFIELEGWTQ